MFNIDVQKQYYLLLFSNFSNSFVINPDILIRNNPLLDVYSGLKVVNYFNDHPNVDQSNLFTGILDYKINSIPFQFPLLDTSKLVNDFKLLQSVNHLEAFSFHSIPSFSNSLSDTFSNDSSSSQSDLKSNIVSKNVDRPHQCNKCCKRFKHKSNLFEHKSIHLSKESFQYVCPFCSKICRLKGNLKKHLQVHLHSVVQLEEFWKSHFLRSSGRPRKYMNMKKIIADNNNE